MNLTNFISNFQGGARPSLFRVDLTAPAAVGGDGERKAQFMIKGAQLPEAQVNAVPVFYMGREVKVAGGRTFTPLNLTVVNDVDFAVRRMFERWQALMNTHEGNLGVVALQDYVGEMVITQLGRDGAALQSYKIIGCFPSNISAIDLSFDQADAIEEFTVTMEYQWWETAEVV